MGIGPGIAELVDADPGCEGQAGLGWEGAVTEADTADHRALLRSEARHAHN